jgi:hypothetical protein
MLIRPFNSSRFLVDIAQGDILAESGQLLICGKPGGLRTTGHRLDDPSGWEPADFPGHQTRRIRKYRRGDLSWESVYSFPYSARSRARLPEGPSDLAALHYYLLRNEFELFLVQVLRRCRIPGDATVGLIPLSWRQPDFVAHAMVEALAGLFFCRQHATEPRTLTVVIRSLDEPVEMLRVFDRDYFRGWRRRLRWFREACDVWFPA